MMNNTKPKVSLSIAFLLAIIVFASCSENREADELYDRVNSVIEENPDSALAMLDSARRIKDSFPRSQQMKYELLRAKAQNKAYVDFKSDSTMKEVVEYYDDHGTPNEQMEAHYLLGCVYRDLHESPMALSCYLDATEKADTLSEDCDYGLLMRVYGQIADEYHRQAMPYKEIDAYGQFKRNALKNKDTLNYIVGIEGIADAYMLIQDTANHIKYIEEAYKLFRKNGYNTDAARSIPTLIQIYLDRNEINVAEKYMELFEKESNWFDEKNDISKGHERYYYSKGLYYEKTNKLDSAEFYYRKLLSYGYDYDAYKGLLSLYERISVPDSIKKYHELWDVSYSNAYTSLYTQAMFNAEGLFNYSRNSRIASEKTIEAERSRTNSIIIVIVFIAAIAIFVRYILRKRIELKKLTDACNATKDIYLKTLEDYNLLESNFEEYKAKKKEEVQELEEKWEAASAKLDKKNHDKVMLALHDNIAVKNILDKDIHSPQYTPEISNAEWMCVCDVLKDIFPDFYISVINNKEISDQERKIAILTLLGKGTKSIAYLLQSTPSNVSNAKTSINNKLFSNTTAKTLYSNFINIK